MKRGLHPVRLVAHHDDDGARLRGEHRIRHAGHHRFPVDRGQHLVDALHAARTARRKDDGGDAGFRTPPSIPGFAAGGGARLRARGDLAQQPARAHRGEILAGHIEPGEQPLQHPVDAVELGRTRAAGKADHADPAAVRAQQQKIAGIDGHAEVLDTSAGALDRRGNDVTAVGDRRRAHHEDRRTAARGQGFQGAAQILDRMGAADLGFEMAAQAFEPAAGDGRRLVENRRPGSGQRRLNQTDGVRRKRRDSHAPLFGASARDAPRQHLARHRERYDLDGRHQLCRRHHRIGCDGRQRDGLVHRVQPLHAVRIDDRHAAVASEQIDPAGERPARGNARSRHGLGDFARGLVLAHVAFFEPCRDDLGYSGGEQMVDVAPIEDAPLLEHAVFGLEAVSEDRAFGLGRRHGAELHAAFPRRRDPPTRSPERAFPSARPSSFRLFRLWTGRNSSTWGRMARTPSAFGSNRS